jgi:hypothetical protein
LGDHRVFMAGFDPSPRSALENLGWGYDDDDGNSESAIEEEPDF